MASIQNGISAAHCDAPGNLPDHKRLIAPTNERRANANSVFGALASARNFRCLTFPLLILSKATKKGIYVPKNMFVVHSAESYQNYQ